MHGNYTQAAIDRCFKLQDEDIYDIWDAIESLSEEDTAEQWEKKCEKLAGEYSFSSRFAIIRILCSRSQKCSLREVDLSKGFSYVINGKNQNFTGIKAKQAKGLSDEEIAEYEMKHLENLSAKELAKYEEILFQIAETRPDAGKNENYTAYLLTKAMRDEKRATEYALKVDVTLKKKAKLLLSREEAFELGHVLGFSLEEMNWFLLRVFDFEDSFCYNSSNDLIEAYGFKIDTSYQHVRKLKEDYELSSRKIPKADVSKRDPDWTRSASDSFVDLVDQWSQNPDHRDEEFLKWILRQAPVLDLPSRTATSIYQKIALYVYGLCTEVESEHLAVSAGMALSAKSGIMEKLPIMERLPIISIPDSREEFINKLKSLAENPDQNVTFDLNKAKVIDGKLSEYLDSILLKKANEEEKKASKKKKIEAEYLAEQISGQILKCNREIFTFGVEDTEKIWKIPSSNKYGHPHLSRVGNPGEGQKHRVQKLLLGEENVEKGDMLQLLWLAFNFYWKREWEKLSYKEIPMETIEAYRSKGGVRVLNRKRNSKRREAPIQTLEDLTDNFMDFMNTVEFILDKALLPPFYPPHMMEQSMMLSIVVSVDHSGVPAFEYARLYESLVKKRKREAPKTMEKRAMKNDDKKMKRLR